MSIVFECPSCKVRLSTQSSGRNAFQCPKCNTPIALEIQATIPVEAAKIIPTSTVAPSAPPPGIDLSIFSKPALAKPKSQVPLNGSPEAIKLSDARPSEASSRAAVNDMVVQNGLPNSGKPVANRGQPVHNSAVMKEPTLQTASVSSPSFVTGGMMGASTEISPLEELIQTGENELSMTGLPKSVHLSILKRKKRQNLIFFVTNSILAVMILAFGGLLYWKTWDPAAKTNQPTEKKSNLVTEDFDGKADPEQITESESTGLVDSTSDVVAKSEPPARPKFDFFSKNQTGEIWKRTKPNLVALVIDGPLGKRKAVGLIVDSRGWIVTSYQAVKDASRIEVTAAKETLDQTNAEAPLVDLVRGRVIDDPKFDLAILAINRRFVVSLAEASITSQDRLVPALRLLAAAPPSNTNYWGIFEANIVQRDAVDQLPLSAKSRIELNQVGSPELSWLTMDGASEWLPGTPLLDQSGTVQAMVSFTPSTDSTYTEKKRALAVPLKSLGNLIDQATDLVTPLSSNLVQTKDGNTALLPDNHPSKKPISGINSSALQCREFGWIPENEEQYEQLAEFTKKLADARDFLISEKPDHRSPTVDVAGYEQVEKLMKEVTEEVSTHLKKVLQDDPRSFDSLNRFAEKKLSGGSAGYVPMFAKVTETGLQFKQFVVQLEGLETHCAIPFDPVARTLLPGTFWWLVVETKKSGAPTIYKIGEEKREIEAYSAFQRLEIGPLDFE